MADKNYHVQTKRFRTNLGEVRRSAGLLQADVARKAKLSLSYYARIEQGYHDPSPPTTKALARVLRVPMAALAFLPIPEVSTSPGAEEVASA